MRKSQAPSFPLDSSIKIPPNTKMRSVDDILKLLKKEDNESKPLNDITSLQPLSTNTLCNTAKENKILHNEDGAIILYNVVWGKRTTKKHKTFEGDGTLRICGKSTTLFDADGTILGRSENIKIYNITERSIISIGSKEVQIVESIPATASSSHIFTSQKCTNKYPLKSVNNSKKNISTTSRKLEDNIQNKSKSIAFQRSDVTITTTNDHCAKKVYNIVWGKKSSKKHKTFEGDGTLEIFGKSLTLRDTDGTILGRSGNIDTSSLSEGSIISIGSKEIQIIESVSKTTSTPISAISENSDASQYKKMKLSSKKSFSISKQLKKKSFDVNYEPLIMPEPNEEHQWLHNTNNKTLCKVSVEPCLVKVLRPHQKEGVIFLYRCLMGFYGEHIGAVLADEMGLGKTLQCITLTWTLLKQGPYGIPCLKHIMVVAPSSLCTNWHNEFMRWLGSERICCFLVDSKNKPKDYAKLSNVPVIIISYEMVTRYIDDVKSIPLDLLICDEGHRLKNTSIKVSTHLSQIQCKRRIIVTGTPIQNDLQEFYSIINFVNPGILGSANDFKWYFLEPIMTSQQFNCSIGDKELGGSRAKELQEKTSHFILRRTQEIINKYLPKKQELVLFCKISELQQKLYKSALEFYENRRCLENNDVVHLQLISYLKKICNHPFLIKEGNPENEMFGALKHHLVKLLENYQLDMYDSGKIRIIQNLIKAVHLSGEKIVLVSYFTQTLDLLAEMCEIIGYSYTRLDGTTPTGDRQKIIDQFNNPRSSIFVFLLSAKAGGVGLNITGASRLVLFDTDWNPASDLQAMSRIWRDGQKKSVYIYRLLTTGTIEEKMYQRQMSKTSLSGTIVDMHNESSSLKLSQNDLKEIFKLNENKCSTHDILQCKCICDGTIPISLDDNEVIDESNEERPCQLSLNSSVNSNSLKKSLRMHELFQWEHHKYPIAPEVLKNLGLEDASDDIFFIFRNQGTC